VLCPEITQTELKRYWFKAVLSMQDLDSRKSRQEKKEKARQIAGLS